MFDSKITQAYRFMMKAHECQMYGVFPYHTHPYMVAMCVPHPTETEVVAALLHDVVEDTPHTLEELEELFGSDVAEIVDLLTKRPGLSYKESIDRIINSGNRSAMKVKLADNMVNMSGDKSHMPEERRKRLETKYDDSFAALTLALK